MVKVLRRETELSALSRASRVILSSPSLRGVSQNRFEGAKSQRIGRNAVKCCLLDTVWLLRSSAHSSSGYTQKASQPNPTTGEADALQPHAKPMSSWQLITAGLGELFFTEGVATVRFPASNGCPNSHACGNMWQHSLSLDWSQLNMFFKKMERDHDGKKLGKSKREIGVRYEDNSLYTQMKFFKIMIFLKL